MERGTPRLLHDLDVVGRTLEDRPSALDRLRLEVGPPMARKLVPVDARSTTAGPARRGRRVA